MSAEDLPLPPTPIELVSEPVSLTLPRAQVQAQAQAQAQAQVEAKAKAQVQAKAKANAGSGLRDVGAGAGAGAGAGMEVGSLSGSGSAIGIGDRAPSPKATIPGPASVARAIVPDPGPRMRSPFELPFVGRRRERASEIHPDGRGEYAADDLTFNAKIARDGRVDLTDKPNFNARLTLPGPRTVASALRAWSRDPYGYSGAEAPAGSHGDIEQHLQSWDTEPYGGQKTKLPEPVIIPVLGGGFDVTDWAVRKSGGDPYYARKKAFLDRTREQRAGMAKVAESENLRDSIANLRGHLHRIWRYQPWSRADRRRALFQLWDECAETGSTQVVDAANAARATVIAFIREHLPADSEHGFSDDELARLNRERQSSLEFRPYD